MFRTFMLKNDTLENGTSHIGLYGSSPPLGIMWIKTLNKEMTCHREEIEQKKLIKGICLERVITTVSLVVNF